ncbi:hypothetical protein F2Q68_00031871 [Brassica cretica]|uniref:Ubiquitin-like protease family profile domain-containing protein n=1 Tax=Brassica cretica TaxID=69181 RepID=A0A8S9G790_BRACR|nr:hypothetical protein F2Q68_00031871 [Brassica cretica]
MREEIEQLFKDMTEVMTAGFGQCVKEVKLLGGRMEALEKKVRINQKGTDSNELQVTLSDTGKDAKEPGSESVNRDKGGRGNNVHTANTEPSVVIMDKTKSTKSDLVKEEERRVSKKDIVKEYCRAKSERERKLAASQQSPFLGNSTTKQIVPTKNVGHGYDPFAPVDKKNAKVLLDFLKKDPSDRLCFLDSSFGMMWVDKYGEFKSSEPGINDVDDIYAPVNYKNEHWIAIWVLIPKKHITIWDSIHSHIKHAQLAELIEPFTTMIPYLLVELAPTDEERVKYTLEPFTYERVKAGVPVARSGDCGVYTLKYIECHALGMSSFPPVFSDKNVKTIREKMVTKMFAHDLCYHRDGDDADYTALDMYEGQ